MFPPPSDRASLAVHEVSLDGYRGPGPGLREPAPHCFRVGQDVVYSGCGVGRIEWIGEREIAGDHIEMIQVSFPCSNLTAWIPVGREHHCGLRPVADRETIHKALEIIVGHPLGGRLPWVRRAPDYTVKLKSGDLLVAAEIVRDLSRSLADTDYKFSERQMLYAALDRVASEVAAARGEVPEHTRARLIAALKDAQATRVRERPELAETA